MPFSNSKLTRDEVLSRFFPLLFTCRRPGQNGLSGGSCIISDGVRRLVLRQPHDPDAPAREFLRQYRTLSRLPKTVVPAPLFYSPGWLAVEYCDGELKSTLPECPRLAGLLYHLHRQPRLGWRVALAPLLERYCWPRSCAAHAAVVALA